MWLHGDYQGSQHFKWHWYVRVTGWCIFSFRAEATECSETEVFTLCFLYKHLIQKDSRDPQDGASYFSLKQGNSKNSCQVEADTQRPLLFSCLNLDWTQCTQLSREATGMGQATRPRANKHIFIWWCLSDKYTSLLEMGISLKFCQMNFFKWTFISGWLIFHFGNILLQHSVYQEDYCFLVEKSTFTNIKKHTFGIFCKSRFLYNHIAWSKLSSIDFSFESRFILEHHILRFLAQNTIASTQNRYNFIVHNFSMWYFLFILGRIQDKFKTVKN